MIEVSKNDIYKRGTAPHLQDLERQTGVSDNTLKSYIVQSENERHDDMLKNPKKYPDSKDEIGLSALDHKVWDMAKKKVIAPDSSDSGIDSIDDRIEDALTNQDGQSVLAEPYADNEADTLGATSGLDSMFSDQDMQMFSDINNENEIDYENPNGSFGDLTDLSSSSYGDVADTSATSASSVNKIAEPSALGIDSDAISEEPEDL